MAEWDENSSGGAGAAVSEPPELGVPVQPRLNPRKAARDRVLPPSGVRSFGKRWVQHRENAPGSGFCSLCRTKSTSESSPGAGLSRFLPQDYPLQISQVRIWKGTNLWHFGHTELFTSLKYSQPSSRVGLYSPCPTAKLGITPLKSFGGNNIHCFEQITLKNYKAKMFEWALRYLWQIQSEIFLLYGLCW